jgi:hypothetical protein
VLWALRGSISDVPMSMVSRAFIIAMKRGTPRRSLQKQYFNDPDFVAVRAHSERWAASVQLNPDPEIPAELSHDPRLADNCRPLLAIADSLDSGAEARTALIELCAPNPDVVVQALADASLRRRPSISSHSVALIEFRKKRWSLVRLSILFGNPGAAVMTRGNHTN